MTREEAIEILEGLAVPISAETAFDMAIDVLKQPEIVRCRDCKHQVKEWRDDKRLKDKGYWVYGCKMISDACGYWACFGQDNEFCSDAERKEGEADEAD